MAQVDTTSTTRFQNFVREHLSFLIGATQINLELLDSMHSKGLLMLLEYQMLRGYLVSRFNNLLRYRCLKIVLIYKFNFTQALFRISEAAFHLYNSTIKKFSHDQILSFLESLFETGFKDAHNKLLEAGIKTI